MDRYRNISISTLKRANGDQKLADFIADKNYWEYYWDLENYNTYCKELEEERKKHK